jgi:hypothetical protein
VQRAVFGSHVARDSVSYEIVSSSPSPSASLTPIRHSASLRQPSTQARTPKSQV